MRGVSPLFNLEVVLKDWKKVVEKHGYTFLKVEGSRVYFKIENFNFSVDKTKFPPKKIAIKQCTTPKEWCIHLFHKKHGESYNYEKFEWTGKVSDYATTTCKTHGDFSQIINNHLKGYGCFKCFGSEKLKTEDVILRCLKARGDRYSYDGLLYNHENNKITVGCKVHGLFETNLYSHLKGVDCPSCAKENSFGSSLSNQDFISKAKKVHGNTYDYSFVNYENTKKPVKIKCSKHGIFEQVPNYHLSGNGCQECGKEKTGRTRTGYRLSCPNGSNLYVLKLEGFGESFFKVGISKNVNNRVRGITCESGYSVSVIEVYFNADASIVFDKEKEAHRMFKQFRYKPKKKFTGDTECFSTVDLEILKSLMF